MKTILFSALLLFSFGAVASSDGMYSESTLVFETPDGKVLHMEAYQEEASKEDVPPFLRSLIYHENINPEDRKSFQALVRSLQKPEKEEELPFDLD